jgi:hypothetical protein
MSEKALTELEAIRQELLEKQTKCAWCEMICKNADHLYMHIMLKHQDNLESK